MKTIVETEADAAGGWATHLAAVTANVDPRDSGMIEISIGSLLRVVREQLKLEVVFIGEFVDAVMRRHGPIESRRRPLRN